MDAPAAPTPLDATLYQLAALSMRAVEVAVPHDGARARRRRGRRRNPARPRAPPRRRWPRPSPPAKPSTPWPQPWRRATPHIEILARAVDRLGRSVRRTVALISRRQAGWPAPSQAGRRRPNRHRQPPGHGPPPGRPRRRRHHPLRVRRRSRRAPVRRPRRTRLDDPDLAEEIQALPVEEVVRRICRDLGLTKPRQPPPSPDHPDTACVPPPARGRSCRSFRGREPVEAQWRGGSG